MRKSFRLSLTLPSAEAVMTIHSFTPKKIPRAAKVKQSFAVKREKRFQ